MRITLPRLILSLSLLIVSSSTVLAFGSSSTNYKLEGEFGIFGGAKSSTNYNLTDTGGGFAIGFGSSANYGTGSGFQYVLAEIREIIFTINPTLVNLGSLSGTPKGVSNTITVTTNAREGYQVTVMEDGNICRTTQPCNAANDIADEDGDDTTLCYSAAISGTTAAGNYQHVLTYIATGTF